MGTQRIEYEMRLNSAIGSRDCRPPSCSTSHQADLTSTQISIPQHRQPESPSSIAFGVSPQWLQTECPPSSSHCILCVHTYCQVQLNGVRIPSGLVLSVHPLSSSFQSLFNTSLLPLPPLSDVKG